MTPRFASLFGSQPGRSPLNGLTTPAQSKPMRPFTSTAFRPQVTPLPPVANEVRPLPPISESVVRPLPPVSDPPPRPMPLVANSPITLASFQSSVPQPKAAPLPPVKPLAQPPWGDQQLVTNQNAFKLGVQPKTVDPLASLVDQSQQFSASNATKTQDAEPELDPVFAGGSGWSEQTLSPADYVSPFFYQPYQPTRRYEVL